MFTDFPRAHNIYINQTGAFYFSQACSEDVFKCFQSQTCDSYHFISNLMGVFFLWLVLTSRLSSQTTWLKVKPYCKSLYKSKTNLRSDSSFSILSLTIDQNLPVSMSQGFSHERAKSEAILLLLYKALTGSRMNSL